MSDRSAIAIAKFLGKPASVGGPLALLGLDPAQLHDISVVAALEQRLSQVWEHAEGDSPEADEVRLALHAAAAQLLDPVMRRRALAASTPAVQPAQTSVHPTETPRTQPARTPASPQLTPPAMAMLERDAMLTLARHGGWSPQALREVAMMGAVRGLGPDDVATALHKLSRGGGKRKPTSTPTATPTVFRPAQIQPQARLQQDLPQANTQPSASPSAHRPHPASSHSNRATASTFKPEHSKTSGPISDIAIFAGIVIALLFGAGAAIVAFTSSGRGGAPTTGVPTQGTPQGQAGAPQATPALPIFSANGNAQQQQADSQQATPTPSTAATPQTTPTSPAVRRATTPDPRPEQQQPDVVIADLRRAVASLADRPADSIALFESAWMQLASWWPDYDLGRRRAATGAIVEIVVVASAWEDVLDRIINIIAEPSRPLSTGRYDNAGQPLHASSDTYIPTPLDARLAPNAAWSAATIARLSGERQLSASLSRRLDRLVLDRFGSWPAGVDRGIEPALSASLRRIPAAILNPATAQATSPPNRSAAAWIAAVDSLYAQTAPSQSGIVADDPADILFIDAIDTLLRKPQNNATSADVREFLQLVADHINWATSSNAQRRLIDWLRDPAIHPAGLQTVTASIVSGPQHGTSTSPSTSITASPIMGAGMILPPTADPSERGMLAIEYARAWGLADAARATEAESAWRSAVSSAIQAAHEAQYPDQILASAVSMSMLSESALYLWRGEPEAAARLAQSASARSAAAIAPAAIGQPHEFAHVSTDASWAIRFIEAGRNRTVLLALLEELERRGYDGLSIIEAEVLAEAAAFGVPLDVRAKAQDVTAYLARNPAIVNAVLETLPRAARTRPFGILVERVAATRLPPVTDDRWPVEARRALVERLLMMRAGEGQAAAIDRLVALLAESYEARRNTGSATTQSSVAQPASTNTTVPGAAPSTGGGSSGGSSGGGGGGGADAEVSALRLALWTNELVEGYRADARRHQPNPRAPVAMREIDRRLAGRRLLAQGPIQSFAADQASLAELMAYIVSAERPGRADHVLRITRDAEHARQTANHVFNQILAGERAMLELWLIRLGEIP